MRFIRSAATTLTLAGAATLAASAMPAFTPPAFAQGPVIDVTPSTAAPGASVTFAITCNPSTSTGATLFGTTLGLAEHIPMTQSTHAGEFVVTVALPTDISPGGYSPEIDCSDGTVGIASLTVSVAPTSPASPVIDVTPSTAAPGASVTFAITCGTNATSATLSGTTLGLPEQIPMDPGTHAGEFVVTVTLPTDIGPGGYSPSIDCSDGTSGTASLTVNPAPIPTGAPVTGDGTTSSATGGPFTTAGLALLAVGGLAVGAGVIRKRRRPLVRRLAAAR
jgi:hypothetical protein